jgi:prolyl oligopeptidase PreP (S9A serine peptidase family)
LIQGRNGGSDAGRLRIVDNEEMKKIEAIIKPFKLDEVRERCPTSA